MKIKPLLAETLEDVTKAQLPVMASVKLDGIRALIIDGVVYSRNLKPIRNKFVQDVLGHHHFNGLDGELVVGDIFDGMAFRQTSSGVMSVEGTPEFTYWVFDRWDQPDRPFEERFESLAKDFIISHPIKILPHYRITDTQKLEELEELNFNKGFEGTMIRDPQGRYKYGRSTLNERILLKLKRFKQEEAVIVGFQERMHNANEATTNALGYTERSTHKENMVGRGDLGALIVKWKDKEFSIGSGFTDDERREFWNNKEKYLGKIVTFKFFAYGEYDLPRFPIYVGLRDPDDM